MAVLVGTCLLLLLVDFAGSRSFGARMRGLVSPWAGMLVLAVTIGSLWPTSILVTGGQAMACDDQGQPRVCVLRGHEPDLPVAASTVRRARDQIGPTLLPPTDIREASPPTRWTLNLSAEFGADPEDMVAGQIAASVADLDSCFESSSVSRDNQVAAPLVATWVLDQVTVGGASPGRIPSNEEAALKRWAASPAVARRGFERLSTKIPAVG